MFRETAVVEQPILRARVEAVPGPAMSTAGSIAGMVQDASDITIAGATVTLAFEGASQPLTTQSDEDGAFAFPGVAAGPYRLTIALPGFEPWTASGVLATGQKLNLAKIALSISSVKDAVEVTATRREIAAAQVGFEEKQRVLGVFPNFYASYIWDATPLTAGQKFGLAWRFSTDPVAFGMAGVVAGAEQWHKGFSGYGQGAQGYGKRFGATYTDGFTSTMLGQAVFPAIFRQDPRYFVKGTGSVPARALYAIASAVICRGDNRRWQLNYSNILGNVTSASISNLYYPAASRNGAGLTVENSLVTTALGALGGLVQEFMLHRMTPRLPDYSTETK